MDQRPAAEVALTEQRFVVGFTATCMLLAAAVMAMVSRPELLLYYELHHKRHGPEARAVINALLAGDAATDDATALARLDRAAALLTSAPELSDLVRAKVFAEKGEAHWRLWQYVEAQEAWQRALAYAGGAQQDWLRRRIADGYRIIERGEGERAEYDVYEASPGVGPAAVLTGRVAVIYVLLEDGGPGSWSARTKGEALRWWAEAEHWLAGQANRHGAELRFSRRVFLVNRSPQIRRQRVTGRTGRVWSQGALEVAGAVARLAARELGAADMLSLARRFRREERADHAVVLLHVERDGRSFARRCHVTCDTAGEYAYLMESSRPREWQSTAYAQAHETLHLFGADDLYNIKGAARYMTRDVMHQPSRLLAASTMEELTAFAVGLRPRPPRTPFKIVTLH